MLALFGLALGAPPIPTWTYATIEPSPAEDDDDQPLPTDPSPPAHAPATSTVPFDPLSDRRHSWADEATLTFDLSTDVGRFDYVMVTARGRDGLVAHWRQGPYAGEDMSRTFALTLPAELVAVLDQHGPARLTLDVVTTNERDVPLGRSRLGVTWVELRAGTPQGALLVDENGEVIR